MEHSLGSDVNILRHKDQQHYGLNLDGGYSDSFHSPKKESEAKYDPSPKSFCGHGYHETPKENLKLRREHRNKSVTPKKDRSKGKCLDKDLMSEPLQPLLGDWCETPRVLKRDPSLCRRLLMLKTITEVKSDNIRTPFHKKTESFGNVGSRCSSNVFFDSPDAKLMGALATSTLKPEDVPQSGRKRRLLFSHVKTSTLEDGKCNLADLSSFERNISLSDGDLDDSIISSNHLSAEMLHTPDLGKFLPSLKENFLTPVNNGLTDNLGHSPTFLSALSCTPTPKNERSVSEDSGFSSLALDKSQDSSVDYDGSFQELLPSSASRARNTPRLTEIKTRAKLERQRRLSTLREGGSQSDEDNGTRARANSNLTGKLQQHLSVANEEDVFDLSVTPLRTPGASDVSLDDLSLTPALQLVHAMCQRNASRSLSEQSSFEVLLRVAAAAVATPETFRTTMPLAGLIGRKIGLGKMDVITELKKRNLRHILAVVFRHLSSEDVYRFGQVSDSWNEIILQDHHANHRRKLYVKETKAAFELTRASRVPDAETRLTLASRSALKLVQAQARTPNCCTPQSASGSLTPLQHSDSHSSSRREEFQQVAKTLFNDECLKPCPRCQRPARCHTVKRQGVCSRQDCSFQFCTACLRPFHGSKECVSRSGSSSRRKKDLLLPGSAQSKRNLRRL